LGCKAGLSPLRWPEGGKALVRVGCPNSGNPEPWGALISGFRICYAPSSIGSRGMPANQNPEEVARNRVDELPADSGWAVQGKKAIDFHAGLGIAIREYPLFRCRFYTIRAS
jgi:hypothetical protein